MIGGDIMRQTKKKNEKDKVAIVLMLCFCVIALTSIFTVKANIDKLNKDTSNVPVSENAKTADDAKQNKGTVDTTTDSDSSLDVVKPQTIDSLNTSKDKTSFINPVNSDKYTITNPYSMDKLIYSVTLDQYMTHCGVDIKVPDDTQVLAVSEGTVTGVYQDDRYGHSILISHGNGLVSVYSNLSEAKMVETGDTVKKGQIIGGVGSSALFESSEPAHLHFEMQKDGVYVNPADYIKF